MCVHLETFFLAIAWNIYFSSVNKQIRCNCVLFLHRDTENVTVAETMFIIVLVGCGN